MVKFNRPRAHALRADSVDQLVNVYKKLLYANCADYRYTLVTRHWLPKENQYALTAKRGDDIYISESLYAEISKYFPEARYPVRPRYVTIKRLLVDLGANAGAAKFSAAELKAEHERIAASRDRNYRRRRLIQVTQTFLHDLERLHGEDLGASGVVAHVHDTAKSLIEKLEAAVEEA